MTQIAPLSHALIVGGGIGGLAAAIALKRMGVRVTVFERAATEGEVGAGLALWANAIRALNRLDLAAPVRAIGVREVAGAIRSWQGELLMPMDARALEQRLGEVSVVVHRAELHALLLEALQGNGMQFGAQCVGFTQDAQGVHVLLADGQQAHGDLLVGADGLRSVVRAQLFGGEPPRYAGYTAWRGVTSFDHARLTPGESWGQGARFGMVPLSRERVYWFATQNVAEGVRPHADKHKQVLLDQFRGWQAPIEALIASTDESAILCHDIYDRDPLPHWSIGRVTLLGDAAHPMTPNLGQGACQALEDAVVLADTLAAHPTVEMALYAYEAQRMRRTSALVRQARLIGRIGQWENPLACRLRNTLLKHMPARTQDRQIDQVMGYRV